MTKAISADDILGLNYRTTKAADAVCSKFLERLGHKARYFGARLSLARSLSILEKPALLGDNVELATAVRGIQLFGSGDAPKAWFALISQHAGQVFPTQRVFQRLVAAHWTRGAHLLASDWKNSSGKLDQFILQLADLASLAYETTSTQVRVERKISQPLSGNISLQVGPIAKDLPSGTLVEFSVNKPGGRPHMAIMGGTNSGKTYTAITMLKQLREYGDVPMLAFDFKGDLSQQLATHLGARVINPPREAVPLNVLSVSEHDDIGLKDTAGRIRESIGRVKNTKLSGIQAEALRTAVLEVLSNSQISEKASIQAIAYALEQEYESKNRKPDELSATLSELAQYNLFEYSMTPEEFFDRSWIIRLPQDTTDDVRKLIINLTLDALDRWLNSQADSEIVDNRRSIRHLTLLDEAHVILSTKLPALSNLIRMSRSKGGVIMLISQSPDDFEGEDVYLDNMGLTLAFSTQAKPGPTRRIFGTKAKLMDLGIGQAYCRMSSETKTRKVAVWHPDEP